jgi:hypothetical protein
LGPVALKSWNRAALLTSVSGVLAVGACADGGRGGHDVVLAATLPAPTVQTEEAEYHLPPPPFSEGAFPCSDCHDPEIPVRQERRTLTFDHEEIVLRHDEDNRWCLDCHAVRDRDQLHLANGTLIPFEESHRLCGQCHGDKYRDWKAGVHGRREGNWDGEKSYLLCVHCHDAHAPAFEPIAPLPAPKAPRRTW